MTVKCRPLVTCRGESSPASPAMTGSDAPGRAVRDLERLLLFNGYREFGVVNRPEGNKLTVRVMRPEKRLHTEGNCFVCRESASVSTFRHANR
jgi:hypothetical protein